mgnify:CR=1 FL=1
MDLEKAEKLTSPKAMAGEYRASLGDTRLNRRQVATGKAISSSPELSIPKLFPDEADAEATYALLRNQDVAWRDQLQGHMDRTVARAVEAKDVLVAHDTTEVSYVRYWPDDKRKHMSMRTSHTQGFLLHTSLVARAEGAVAPLGVLDLQPFVHSSDIDTDDQETVDYWEGEGGLLDNEMRRWFRSVAVTQDLLSESGVKPIHLMDREGDSYGLLSWLAEMGYRFVVRCDAQRGLRAVEPARELGEVTVALGERFPNRTGEMSKSNPPRRARQAILTIRSSVVELRRSSGRTEASWSPGGYDDQPRTLELHMVEAVERHPPAGERGVRWQLLTTEPIDTPEEVLKIVEYYRRRWLIEEYFKALKTGCKLQERQMASMPNMLRMLALLVPAAWRLLLLRTVSIEMPLASWKRLLTPLEFKILSKAVPKAKLGATSTVHQCMMAIAKLGGHFPHNGLPGWQTLQAGWRRLHDMLDGALLAAGLAINP